MSAISILVSSTFSTTRPRRCRWFAARNRKQRDEGKPETFTFMGFTHFCGQRISDKAFVVWRITAKKRMGAKQSERDQQVSAGHLRQQADGARQTGRRDLAHPPVGTKQVHPHSIARPRAMRPVERAAIRRFPDVSLELGLSVGPDWTQIFPRVF